MKNLQKHFGLLIPVIIFVAIKLFTSGTYISDSGNYFYVASQMLHGQVLYRDIFFANLPMLPLVSILYFFLSISNLWLYNFSVVLEIVAISSIIYYLAFKRSGDTIISTISASLFLLSSFIFLTSVSQTFVFTAGLFLMVGYLFFEKQKPILAGIFLGLSFLTKAYFLPLIAALLLTSLIKRKWKFSLKLTASTIITTILIIIPFVFLAGNALWKDIVEFSLNGFRFFSISDLLLFFVTHEPLLTVFLIASISFIKRDLATGIMSIGFLLLFFFYQSMKPLYMVMIIPFLALYLINLLSFKEFQQEIRQQILFGLVFISLVYTFFGFGILKANEARVTKIDSIVYQVGVEKPDFIYGTDGIAPSVAYLANVPLLDNQINTDDALFAKGMLDSKLLTKKAIESKTIFIALGYLDENGGMRTVNNMFDLDSIVAAKCGLIDSYQIEGQLKLNHLFMFKCY